MPRRPLSYLLITGACLALHNAVMIAADAAGAPLWLAVLASFAMVATAGYLLFARFTFRQDRGLVPFLRYVVAMSANIPLAFVTIWLWHEALALPMAIAAPAASLCTLAVNFILTRWAFAFRRPDPASHPA